jgi:murein DD-endopeptidase MepM/ murein hydrolase activator NlpD
MFGATGAAVATSPATAALTGGPGAALTPTQPAAAQDATKRAAHLKAAREELALVRATRVARGVARKKLAARVADAKRAVVAKRAAVAKRVALAHRWQMPITNPVKTSNFGYRWGRLHAGEDFAVSVGTPLASMSSGTVLFAGPESGYGNLVQIRYWDGTVSYYGHMSSISAKVGEAVVPGQVIGQSGNTGHSTGPHLHLEIHPDDDAPINPAPWLEAHDLKD